MNFSEKKLNQRSKIYKKISPTFDKKHGIIVSKKINTKDTKPLIKSIENFLHDSLTKYYKKKFIKKNFIQKHINEILGLPNVTPGGQLRGTRETMKTYNNVHKNFDTLLKKIDLYNNLERLAWFSVRIKKGIDSKEYKKHTYATSKKHSDMWAGERNHAKIVLMLIGDTKKNTVSFYKPLKFTKKTFNFGKKSFDQGLQTIKQTQYLGKANKNEICLFDQYCLHQTYLAKGAKTRISIDMRVDIKGSRLNDNRPSVKEDERMVLYSAKRWSKLNYKNIKYHNKSFRELSKLYK